ncbi:MAG: S24 family peptidase [Xanthobacteraceae bacterium]
MAINELRQRVERRLREIELGPVEAVEPIAGLERNYIRDLIEGKKESFSQSKLPLVAEALRWSVTELLGGTDATQVRASSKITRVPLLDSVTAGRLRAPASQIPVEDVPLLAFADLGRGEWFALKVDGDSMDRVSPDGSRIVVNRTDRTLVSGKPYVFSNRGETTYKLWRPEPPRFVPFSTNPMHEPIYCKNRKEAEGMVIGRVKRTVLDL